MGEDVQGQMDESRRDRTGTGGKGRGLPSPSPPQPPRRAPPFCRFWFRLYWFPLKVLYATSYCSLRSVPDIPFYFFFNALLLLLTLMNLYWFLVSWRSQLLATPFFSDASPVPVPVPKERSRCTPFSRTPREEGHVRQRAKGRWQEHPAIRRAARSGTGLSSHLCLPLPQYIVAFAAKVLTGQVRELKDVREYDTAEALSPKPSKAE